MSPFAQVAFSIEICLHWPLFPEILQHCYCSFSNILYSTYSKKHFVFEIFISLVISKSIGHCFFKVATSRAIVYLYHFHNPLSFQWTLVLFGGDRYRCQDGNVSLWGKGGHSQQLRIDLQWPFTLRGRAGPDNTSKMLTAALKSHHIYLYNSFSFSLSLCHPSAYLCAWGPTVFIGLITYLSDINYYFLLWVRRNILSLL